MLGAPQSLKQGRLTLEDQFQYSSLAEGVDRSAHFATFRVSFAIQAFVVRDFTEMEHIVKDFPDKVFRPGFSQSVVAIAHTRRMAAAGPVQHHIDLRSSLGA